MTTVRMTTDRSFLTSLAKALNDGREWGDLAREQGHRPREFQAFYRPRVRTYILRRLSADDSGLGHGTLTRYSWGPCLPCGKRCDPCRKAHADYLRRNRNDRVPLEVGEDLLRQIAERLHGGESWTEIAISLDRTRVGLQQATRTLVQPYALDLVNRDDPPTNQRAHGSHVKYVIDRCRCEPCTYSARMYEKARERKARRGMVPYVDSYPVRRHIEALLNAGIGLKRIAKVSGVSTGGLSKLMYGNYRGRGPSKRVRKATADAVMAVKKSDLAGGALVDAADTWKIIDGLVAQGWSKGAIARQIGQKGPGLQLRRDQVTKRHADTIAALARLYPTPPDWAYRKTRYGQPIRPAVLTLPPPLPSSSEELDQRARLIREMVLQGRVDELVSQ